MKKVYQQNRKERVTGDPNFVGAVETEFEGEMSVDGESSRTEPNSYEQVNERESCHELYIEDIEDEREVVAKKLNGIILQYLESCGLVESYATFYDECKASGMLIPSNYSAVLEYGISSQDIETLLTHFDQDNGDALVEFWQLLKNTLNLEQYSQQVDKITFYIQVAVALVPFRKKMSEEAKSNSMTKLREYFEKRCKTSSMDQEMASLFALPFLPHPETNPVFRDLFQAAGLKKLRATIKSLSRSLCMPNRLMTRDSTDLAKMFRTCSKGVQQEIESSNGSKVYIISNAEPVEFTSGVDISPESHKGSSQLNTVHIFQRMNDLIVENERFKVEESKYEKECSKLFSLSILLIQSLEEATQGKEVNMDKLRNEISQSLHMSLHYNESKSQERFAYAPSDSHLQLDKDEIPSKQDH